MSGRRGGAYLDVRAVAELVGVKPRSIHRYLHRGTMPEPDAIMLNHPLWLETTIEEWQKVKGKWGRRRSVPRRILPPPPEPETLWERPPPTLMRRVPLTSGGASRTGNGASVRPAPVGEEGAKAIAAAVRQAGYHCTSADVLELLAVETGDAPLPHERELLRQRVVVKWREFKAKQGGT